MEEITKRNYYAEHLAEVNRTNPVITTEDICNEQGATIVTEGTYITEEVATKLARFSLTAPIESEVSIETPLSPSQVVNDICFAHTKVLSMDRAPEAVAEFIHHSAWLNHYPLISQKLTVFADRMPDKYDKAQGSTGFAVLIGQQLGLSKQTMEIVFAAAQLYDTGFLSIDPEAAITVDERPYREQKALFAQQLDFGIRFLQQVPKLPDSVSEAVFAYRERKDGSGWPKGGMSQMLSIESQIVGLSVLLFEAYLSKLQPRKYGPQMLIPIIQIESESLDETIYNASISVLNRLAEQGAARVVPNKQIPNLVRYLRELLRNLLHGLDLAHGHATAMHQHISTIETQRPLAILNSIEGLCRNSGLKDSHFQIWLKESASSQDPDTLAEIERVALMLETLLEKLTHLSYTLREAAELLGEDWVTRCDDLISLFTSLPDDYFEELGLSTQG